MTKKLTENVKVISPAKQWRQKWVGNQRITELFGEKFWDTPECSKLIMLLQEQKEALAMETTIEEVAVLGAFIQWIKPYLKRRYEVATVKTDGNPIPDEWFMTYDGDGIDEWAFELIHKQVIQW